MVLLVLNVEGIYIVTSVVVVVVTVVRQLVHTVVTGSLSYSTLVMTAVVQLPSHHNEGDFDDIVQQSDEQICTILNSHLGACIGTCIEIPPA